MEIESEQKKLSIISENLSLMLSKEIEKLNIFIIETREEIESINQKLISLVDKLENSVQQYGKNEF